MRNVRQCCLEGRPTQLRRHRQPVRSTHSPRPRLSILDGDKEGDHVRGTERKSQGKLGHYHRCAEEAGINGRALHFYSGCLSTTQGPLIS